MKLPVYVALGAVLVAPVAAQDEPAFDGVQPVICATLEAVQCAKAPGSDHACFGGNSRLLNVPQFVRVDFEKKTLMVTAEDGEQKTARIDNIGRGNGHIVVQGINNGNGWSLVLEENTGHMTASSVGDEEGKMIFGACTQI